MSTEYSQTNGDIAAQQWLETSTQDETDRFNKFMAKFAVLPEISHTPEVS